MLPIRRNIPLSGQARNSTRDHRLVNVVKAIPDQLDADAVLDEDADGHEF